MPEEKKEGQETSSEVWNISKEYVSSKILKWLVLIDYYDEISVFGASKLEFDIQNVGENFRSSARLGALKRELYCIGRLIVNTKFIVSKEAKESFEKYRERLMVLEKNIWKLRLEKHRGKKLTELSIREELFDQIHNEIEGIVNSITEKLNLVGIIFGLGEEKDIGKLKESYAKRFLTRT